MKIWWFAAWRGREVKYFFDHPCLLFVSGEMTPFIEYCIHLIWASFLDLSVVDSCPAGRRPVILDDCNFHDCVNLSSFELDRSFTFFPPLGEFSVMNYRVDIASEYA